MDWTQSIDKVVGWQLIPIVIFFSIATFTDIKERKIKNWTNAGLATFNILYFIVLPAIQGKWSLVGDSILGGTICFLLLLLPAVYFTVSMGGDIKMAGATGIALGAFGGVTWALLSVVLVLGYGFVQVKLRNKPYTTTIPFAPFLFISLILHIALSLLLAL